MSVAVFHHGGGAGGGQIPLDVSETEAEYRLSIDLPGVDKEAITVILEHGRLTISGAWGGSGGGEQPQDDASSSWTEHVRERPTGPFKRAVVLPSDAEKDSIRAHLRDGVLRICVDRKHEQERTWKSIKITDHDYPFAK